MREHFDRLLAMLTANSRVSYQLVGEVLSRIALAGPEPIARVDLANGAGLPLITPPLSEGSVSRAVKNLLDMKMIEEQDPVTERPGRPLKKLKLAASSWRLVGVHVHTRHGHPNAITGVITGLDGAVLVACCLSVKVQNAMDDPNEFAEAVNELVNQLADAAEVQHGPAHILGVGIDLGGHVNAGTVIDSTPTGWISTELANRIENLIKMPVVIENDVNALTVYETYRHRFGDSDAAYVAVLDEGVGGALIINGRLYRGGFGMAGEIGHIPVEYPPDDPTHQPFFARSKRSTEVRSFGQPCPAPCGEYGHVDCFAPPVRIRAELREQGYSDYSTTLKLSSPAGSSPTSPAEVTLSRAGRALGRALVSLINLVNPTRLVVYLPTELAEAGPDTVGARYAEAMESAVTRSFSTGAVNARAGHERLITLVIPDTTSQLDMHGEQAIDQVDYYLAKSSAWCVLNAFLEHAAGYGRPNAPEPSP